MWYEIVVQMQQYWSMMIAIDGNSDELDEDVLKDDKSW